MEESTKEYYIEKSKHITNLFTNKIKNDIENYEGFLNIPYTKNMIQVKFEYDLEHESASEEDIIDLTIDESISSLIYSSLIKTIPHKICELFLSNQMPISSSTEIKNYIDYTIKTRKDDMKNYRLETTKYIYFGDNNIVNVSKIIKDINIHQVCVGEYKGIKFFYIENLEDIYMSNYSVIDLNTIDIKYNEYIKKEYDEIFDPEDLYENIPNNMKRGVITLNCMLGDVKLLKLECLFGKGVMFHRKLKLQRILKNEIDI